MLERQARWGCRRAVRWIGIACGALASLTGCAGSPARDSKAATAGAAEKGESMVAPQAAAPAQGGARDQRKSPAPATPSRAGEAAEPKADYASPPAPSVEIPAPAGQEFTRRVAPGASDPHSSSANARARLVEARRELDIATSVRDCARACRALESMERAAQQVCELARSPEERRECATAGEQVDNARSKVQSACGGCPQKNR